MPHRQKLFDFFHLIYKLCSLKRSKTDAHMKDVKGTLSFALSLAYMYEHTLTRSFRLMHLGFILCQ